MGNYLNTTAAYDAFYREYSSPYFVDKSGMLEELIPRIETGMNYICITRPRRFGKTVMANMIASFFSGECHAEKVFDSLRIASCGRYRENIGKYDVIFISMNELPRRCDSYEDYIGRIEDRLLRDLRAAYPGADIRKED